MCAATLTEQNKLGVKSLLSWTNCCERLPDSSSEKPWGSFFFPLSFKWPHDKVWLNMSGDCGFSTRITDFTRFPIATSAGYTLYEKCWIVKRETGRKMKSRLWWFGVKAEWCPRCRTHTVSLLESSVFFFPLFHCLEKKNYKTPFYACYGWPSVCTSTALGNGRRRQREICGCSEERGGEVMLGWEKETKMRWKALTEEDDLLWWEPRTERRRYFIS